MICITQLIFVRPGKENVFHEFEDRVLPLLDRHQGVLLYRVRPSAEAFITSEGERPYEIHFVTFPSEEALNSYLHDDERLKHTPLKDESVSSVVMVKGKKW